MWGLNKRREGVEKRVFAGKKKVTKKASVEAVFIGYISISRFAFIGNSIILPCAGGVPLSKIKQGGTEWKNSIIYSHGLDTTNPMTKKTRVLGT